MNPWYAAALGVFGGVGIAIFAWFMDVWYTERWKNKHER